MVRWLLGLGLFGLILSNNIGPDLDLELVLGGEGGKGGRGE